MKAGGSTPTARAYSTACKMLMRKEGALTAGDISSGSVRGAAFATRRTSAPSGCKTHRRSGSAGRGCVCAYPRSCVDEVTKWGHDQLLCDEPRRMAQTHLAGDNYDERPLILIIALYASSRSSLV
jgi:hypothetical protein